MKIPPTAGRRGQKTMKRIGGREMMSTMPSVAMMPSPVGKEKVSSESPSSVGKERDSPEKVLAFIRALDTRAILVVIGAASKIMAALMKANLVKDGEWANSSGRPVEVDVSFTDYELKLTGEALGWLTLRLPEKSQQGGRRMRGGVAPLVQAVVAIVSLLFASFSGNRIYTLNVNRDQVRESGNKMIATACPQYLNEAPPALRTTWLGTVDIDSELALDEYNAGMITCASTKQQVFILIERAEMAFTNAWTSLPAQVGVFGSVVAAGLGAPPVYVTALTSLTGLAIAGTPPTPAELQTTAAGLSNLLDPPPSPAAARAARAARAAIAPPPPPPPPADPAGQLAIAPPAPPAGGRRTARRRVTRRRKTRKVRGTPVFIY